MEWRGYASKKQHKIKKDKNKLPPQVWQRRIKKENLLLESLIKKETAMIPMVWRICVLLVLLKISLSNSCITKRGHLISDALLFLSHFMGDIHQPMHVGFTTNEGGNTIELRCFKHKSNMHHVNFGWVTFWEVFSESVRVRTKHTRKPFNSPYRLSGRYKWYRSLASPSTVWFKDEPSGSWWACDTRALTKARSAKGIDKEWLLAGFQWKGHMNESNIHQNERDLETKVLSESVRVRTKHTGKPCVDVWGQSTAPIYTMYVVWDREIILTALADYYDKDGIWVYDISSWKHCNDISQCVNDWAKESIEIACEWGYEGAKSGTTLAEHIVLQARYKCIPVAGVLSGAKISSNQFEDFTLSVAEKDDTTN
ncbi:hypothetical protein V8G54_035391 [Vigna mungo]|uniref:Aspergillus nuclease S1 n=1 Tax=Vigna mungo TaxID=3915 RepID=A0AAQ3REI8_VIGMU